MSLALAPQVDERVTPLERLEFLCDPGSLQLIRTDVISQPMGDRARSGDGVLGGSGLGVLAQLAGDTTSDLVCIEPHIRELDQDVWMVLHPALRGSERIRAVSNLVADIFR